MASLRARDRARENRQSRGSRGRTDSSLTAAIAAVPETAAFGGGGWATAASALSVAALSLDARIAAARGEHDRAIKYWQQAVAAADRLPYDEPPVWFYPVRESLGAALLAAGRAADAERVFRDDLVKHPRNARSLFGLQAALAKQGKDADAAWVQREFDEAWKNADTKSNAGRFLGFAGRPVAQDFGPAKSANQARAPFSSSFFRPASCHVENSPAAPTYP